MRLSSCLPSQGVFIPLKPFSNPQKWVIFTNFGLIKEEVWKVETAFTSPLCIMDCYAFLSIDHIFLEVFFVIYFNLSLYFMSS